MRLGDIYKPETSIPWYKESFVERPFYEKYWKQAEWAEAVKEKRPGFLEGVASFIPKAAKSQFSGYRARTRTGTLGSFGKGDFVPPPLPPEAAPESVLLKHAYNKKTKNYYHQNPLRHISAQQIFLGCLRT